jgi:hypothetical protein
MWEFTHSDLRKYKNIAPSVLLAITIVYQQTCLHILVLSDEKTRNAKPQRSSEYNALYSTVPTVSTRSKRLKSG